jgi:hypothetical protein
VALPITPDTPTAAHKVSPSNNDKEIGSERKQSVTTTEDIKYVFDTASICNGDEDWDYSRHSKGEQNPEPLKFGQPMQGKRHKYDGEYNGITWKCGALFGTKRKLQKKIQMIADWLHSKADFVTVQEAHVTNNRAAFSPAATVRLRRGSLLVRRQQKAMRGWRHPANSAQVLSRPLRTPAGTTQRHSRQLGDRR